MQHNIDLPGPEFTPRPGWGGRLKAWFDETGRTLAERLIIIIAIPLLLAPIIQRGTDLLTPEPASSPTPPPSIRVTVSAGDGIIRAARTALYEYLALQPVQLALEPEQYLFAEDWISRRMEPYTPEPGEELEFPYEVLSAAVLKAQNLTPRERATWLRYVR